MFACLADPSTADLVRSPSLIHNSSLLCNKCFYWQSAHACKCFRLERNPPQLIIGVKFKQKYCTVKLSKQIDNNLNHDCHYLQISCDAVVLVPTINLKRKGPQSCCKTHIYIFFYWINMCALLPWRCAS